MVDYPPINERNPGGLPELHAGSDGAALLSADGWTAGNAIGSWNNVDTTASAADWAPGRRNLLVSAGTIGSTESAPGIR